MPYLRIEDTVLYVREQGQGPLALFVHGFPLDSSVWDDQLAALADVRRCVALDLRGCGRSDPTRLEALTMERHADDLAELIEALGAAAADVVGLSMGGYVALALLERHPKLVRTLALVDTKAGADSEVVKAARDAAAAQVRAGRRAVAEEEAPRRLLAPGAPAAAVERLLAMARGTRDATLVASLEGMKQRPDRSALLARAQVPAAVIVGELDAVTPPDEARAMAAALPDARLTILPGVGHLTPLEDPAGVSAALRELFARTPAT